MLDLSDEVADLGGLHRRYPAILAAYEEVALRAATATEDELDVVLALVGRRLCELLDVRRASVWIRQADGFFHSRAGHCTWTDISSDVKGMVAGTPGDGFTAEIVATKAPVLIRDACNDPRPVHRSMARWHVVDMLGVPLIIDGDVIGIIFVDNGAIGHDYCDEDVQVSRAFARLAAIAVQQGRFFAELSRRASIVERQKGILERLAEVHNRLTGAVLMGGGPSHTVALLAELVQKPAVLYDDKLRVIASAGAERETIAIPESARSTNWLRTTIEGLSARKPSVVTPPAPELGMPCRQIVTSLMIDRKLCGYLGVVEVRSKISIIDVKIAEHGATVLSLQLLSERRRTEALGEAAEDFLANLLDPRRDEHHLARRACLFGVDLDERHVLVRVVYTEDSTTPARRRATLAGCFGRALGRSGEPLVTTVLGADVLLLPVGREPLMSDAVKRRIASTIRSAADPLGILGAVVSHVCSTRDELLGAQDELAELAELAAAPGVDRVVFADEVGALRLLIAGRGLVEAERFARGMLEPLEARDRSNDGELLSTLRAFLAAGGHIRATAKAMGVHENTVRYRLQRIREVSKINPEHLDTLLDARLALQVIDLIDAPRPAAVGKATKA